MDSQPSDQMHLLPLVELFGSFFEKLTNNHQYKDPLRKELSEFKCVLYTNQMNSGSVDVYLDSLRSKNIIPAENSLIKPETIPVDSATTETVTVNSNNRNITRAKTAAPRTKRAEVVTLDGFLKYRSIAQADKKQVLRSRYSHVSSLEKDPSNLYRILAVSYFTLLMQSPKNKIPDIIDDVAAKRLQLSCAAENLAHEDICGIFCSFFSELIRMKRQQEPLTAILQAFYEMIESEKLFSVGLSSFVKAKIYQFVEQKIPYELIAYQTHLKSKVFKEKVESNDISQLDCVLRLVPYIFEKQIVAHIFENGRISEVCYKPFKSKKQKEEESLKPVNEELNTIHILVEKVFLTVSIFGLFTHKGSPFTAEIRSPIKAVGNTNSAANRDSPPKETMTESATKKPVPEALSNAKRGLKVRTLTVDTASFGNSKGVSQNIAGLSNTPEPMHGEGSQGKSKPGVKLPLHIPTRTLSLNFGSELQKNTHNENRHLAPQGDLGIVSELTNRDPYGDDPLFGDHTKNEKENEFPRMNTGSVSPTRMNQILAPSHLTKQESNVQSPYSADKLPERSYYRNFTTSTPAPSNFSSKSNANTSYNEAVQRIQHGLGGSETKPPRPGHARTNSHGSYTDSYSKLPPRYENGGTPMTLKTYVSTPSLNAHQVLGGSANSYHAARYQKSSFNNEKQQGTTQQSEQSNFYSDICREITNSSPVILGTNGDEIASKNQQQQPSESLSNPGSGQMNAATYQSKAKLKSIISMTPKSVLNIHSSSPSLTTGNSKYTKSYYSNYAANTSYGNTYQQMSPTLKPGYKEGSPSANKYPTNPNYSYQGQQTYQASYTPKSGISKEGAPSYKSYNQGNTSYQNAGYNSPANQTSQGGAGRNTSASFGNQVATLSTNTSFNNNPQSLSNQVSSQTRLT